MDTSKKVLFICEANKLRSPTAAALYADTPGIEAKSAGLATDAHVKLTEELLKWADQIFVMEKGQRNKIRKKFPLLYKQKRIICLYIEDEYEYMEDGLIRLLKHRLGNFFQNI